MKDGQILGRQIALLKDSIETGMLLCWQIIDNVFNTYRFLSIFINLDHELKTIKSLIRFEGKKTLIRFEGKKEIRRERFSHTAVLQLLFKMKT